MEFRRFELKVDINQLEYVNFRTGVERMRPKEWTDIMELPIEMFYYIMVKSAILAGWLEDVVEENKYEEEETWVWADSGEEYIDSLPAGNWPWKDWGSKIFLRWNEIRSLDPN